jgi:hypothetical protein
MKILKILSTLLAAVVIVLAIAYLVMGYTLPDETVGRTEFDVAAPPEKVWQALTDHQKYPEWAPNVARVEAVSDKQWKEYLKDSPDPIDFSVVSEKPARSDGDQLHDGGIFRRPLEGRDQGHTHRRARHRRRPDAGQKLGHKNNDVSFF